MIIRWSFRRSQGFKGRFYCPWPDLEEVALQRGWLRHGTLQNIGHFGISYMFLTVIPRDMMWELIDYQSGCYHLPTLGNVRNHSSGNHSCACSVIWHEGPSRCRGVVLIACSLLVSNKLGYSKHRQFSIQFIDAVHHTCGEREACFHESCNTFGSLLTAAALITSSHLKNPSWSFYENIGNIYPARLSVWMSELTK